MLCDMCGKKLDRLFIVVFDMEHYWEAKEGETINIRTICRPCDQKKGRDDAWEEGRYFFDNLIHNTKAQLTKQDKENMKLLDMI